MCSGSSLSRWQLIDCCLSRLQVVSLCSRPRRSGRMVPSALSPGSGLLGSVPVYLSSLVFLALLVDHRLCSSYYMSRVAALSWIQAFGPCVHCRDCYLQGSHKGYYEFCQCLYALKSFQRHVVKVTCTEISCSVCVEQSACMFLECMSVDMLMFEFSR